MSGDTFVYRVDETDTIVSVSNNWSDFANENSWRGNVLPDSVVGHKLWEFIQDFETQHLYQELFKRARREGSTRKVTFRCDSPDEKRYLQLLIKALPDKHIEITSTITRTESRAPVRLLDSKVPRSSEIATVCSMCKKLKIAEDQWVELEEGLARLKLFEADKMPRLSHGLCATCYQAAMQDIKDYKESKKAQAAKTA